MEVRALQAELRALKRAALPALPNNPEEDLVQHALDDPSVLDRGGCHAPGAESERVVHPGAGFHDSNDHSKCTFVPPVCGCCGSFPGRGPKACMACTRIGRSHEAIDDVPTMVGKGGDGGADRPQGRRSTAALSTYLEKTSAVWDGNLTRVIDEGAGRGAEIKGAEEQSLRIDEDFPDGFFDDGEEDL